MWQELERLLNRFEADPAFRLNIEQAKRFHYLYERASADLARLVTFSAEPELRRYLESLVARKGLDQHVQFLGERDDRTLVDCYQQCDLFSLPNRQVGRDVEGYAVLVLSIAWIKTRPFLNGCRTIASSIRRKKSNTGIRR